MSWERETWVDDDGGLTTGTEFDADHMNNIEDGIEGADSAIATEKSARESADSAEKKAREEAVSAEVTAREADVNAEESERKAADSAEKKAREEADAAEKKAREEAVSAETTARIAAGSGLRYTWSSNTVNSDPGIGFIKQSVSGATLRVSDTDADGNSLGAVLATWDDSSSEMRGYVKVVQVGAPTHFRLYQITGALEDVEGSYGNLPVSAIAGSGPENGKEVRVEFTRTGDKGETGKGIIPCRLATTAALASNTRSGNVLTASSNGALASIDGVAASVGNYILVKDEATGANRGVYKVTSLGGASSKWTMERVAEMDSSAECIPGMLITVAEGTQNSATTFALLTTGTITLNTTALAFGIATAWVEPTLLNSFVNYATSPGVFSKASYRKSQDNRVQLRGLVQHTGGTASQVCIFQLPAGFRPKLQEIFEGQGSLNTGAYQGPVRIDVKENGEVIIIGGIASNTVLLSVSEISFYTD